MIAYTYADDPMERLGKRLYPRSSSDSYMAHAIEMPGERNYGIENQEDLYSRLTEKEKRLLAEMFWDQSLREMTIRDGSDSDYYFLNKNKWHNNYVAPDPEREWNRFKPGFTPEVAMKRIADEADQNGMTVPELLRQQGSLRKLMGNEWAEQQLDEGASMADRANEIESAYYKWKGAR